MKFEIVMGLGVVSKQNFIKVLIHLVYQAWDAVFARITRWNREKKVENATRSGVFLTNFEVFHLVMKLYVRGTQREYSLKPLKHSIVERILVFKR